MGPTPAVAAVRHAVRAALHELPAGELVLVACSGGADSLALAAAAAFEAARCGLRAGAVTVDHDLQEGSAGRAELTAASLRALGLDPVLVVPARVGASGGPEAAARHARYEALDESAERTGASVVLLGHNRDDQAETVLLGLARGSGARSLAGMRPRTGRYVRPLLQLSRETLAAACADQGLEPWQDPHNEDPRFARVRVRERVLPTLDIELGPGVSAALARTADQLRDDADALDQWATAAAGACARRPGELDVAQLLGEPVAVRRRVLRTAAVAAGAPSTDLTARHLAELDRLLTGWRGQGPLELPGRVQASRDGPTVRLRRPPVG